MTSIFSQTFSLALHSTTEFFVVQQSFLLNTTGRNVVFNKNDCWKTKNSVVDVHLVVLELGVVDEEISSHLYVSILGDFRICITLEI